MTSSPGERTRRVSDRYRVSAILGEGGMGVVYDAHDEQRGHRVALKTLKQPSPDAIYRLKREFRALADLSHPNVVQLYDLVVDSHGVSYSMEVIEGADLVAFCRGTDEIAAARRPVFDSISMGTTVPGREAAFASEATERDGMAVAAVDELRLRSALGQLVAALRTLHDAGLVHRDVKPSNVLVTRAGRVVLLDFGLAANRQSMEKESMQGLIGTVAYMSPEQAEESSETGPATDWYAVGVMLFEALTGRLPFAGTFVQMLLGKRNPPPRPSTLVEGVSPDLDDLCVRLLAPSPDQRPTGPEIAGLLGVAEPERGAARNDLTIAPCFTGRTDELAALDRAVERVRGGRPALAWVRGPSGIGKSTLIAEFLARVQARHDDVVVLRGRCYEQELVPFKAVDGLIDGLSRTWRRLPAPDASGILPRAGGALQRLFPVLARVSVLANAPSPPESRDPLEMRTRAFGALREVLQRLCDRRLVVMFLDDLQWIDADTLYLLEEVMRPPDAPRLLLLVSSRSEVEAPGLAQAVAAMDVDRTPVELGPLAADEARTLVASLLGDSSAEVAERVVREAAGSPFFLGELVRYLRSVGTTASINIGDVVRRRISLLPPSARRLLELIAIAGEPLRLRELAAAADSDAERVARDVQVLRVDHLVRAPGGRGDDLVEPYHDRIRAAILDLVAPDTRRDHHRALAVALGGEAAPSRLARHWAGAGDRVRAATYARRAADRAIVTFDFESACELYRMALDLGDHDEAGHRDVQIALAGALANSGRSADAAEMYLAAADTPDPMQRLDVRRRAAEHFLNAGMIERGVETLRAVLAEIGEDLPATNAVALRMFIWNYLRLRINNLRWKARDASQIPPRELFRLDCYISTGLSLGMVEPIIGGVYQVKGLRVALRLGEPGRIFKIAALHGIFLYSQGSQKRARTVTARCHEIASAGNDPFQAAWVVILRGFQAYFAGDYHRAEEPFVEAQRRLHEETTGTTAELNHCRVFHCQILRFQGRYVALRERFDEYQRDARQRGDQYLKTTLHRAFAVRFLAEDDVAAARAALEAAWWSPPEKGFHLQHWYELRAGVEILLYTGDLDVADVRRQMEGLVASRMLRVQVIRAEAASLRLRLALLGVPDWNAKKEIAALRREGISFATVWAGLGAAALATGDERARLLRDTAATADAHGMFASAHAARWRLGETLGGSEGEALVAEARAALTELGAVRPERMLEVLAPFPRTAERR